MPKYQKTPQFEHGLAASTGILVVNLGTPEAPTTAAVRRFLKQFLWDPRVVEYPRLMWWFILNLVILRIRPSRSAEAYQKIWTPDGSPLMLYSQQIVIDLQAQFSDSDMPTVVELAMSYGEPSIDNGIDRLLARGARRILVVPLYPQYSGTTTASVFDAVARKFNRLRWVPDLRFVTEYHDRDGYIDALAASVQASWDTNGRGEKLLMSFHGVPTQTLLDGDPYHCQCQKTARLLAERLSLQDDEWLLSFQSRVGREQWLEPATDDTVQRLGEDGIKRFDVVCPGFAVDCLETLEEIAIQNDEFFKEAGGEHLHYIPALNASAAHVTFLKDLADEQLAGWSNALSDKERQANRERAIAMGAGS